jgi:hypothetical protein
MDGGIGAGGRRREAASNELSSVDYSRLFDRLSSRWCRSARWGSKKGWRRSLCFGDVPREAGACGSVAFIQRRCGRSSKRAFAQKLV